jgi:RimJ/RimL family protein N-acetyltransferase
MTTASPIVLKTKRFEMRTLGSADSSEAFRRWASDADLMEPMNLPARSLTADQVRNYFGTFDNIDRFFFGIFDRATGTSVGFWMIEANSVHQTATWNIAIDQANWGEDVAVETGIPLLDYLFDVRGIRKMITLTLPTNEKVISRMKLGSWRQEGYFVRELQSLNGPERLDQVRFALLSDEWPAARKRVLELWANNRKQS